MWRERIGLNLSNGRSLPHALSQTMVLASSAIRTNENLQSSIDSTLCIMDMAPLKYEAEPQSRDKDGREFAPMVEPNLRHYVFWLLFFVALAGLILYGAEVLHEGPSPVLWLALMAGASAASACVPRYRSVWVKTEAELTT